MNNDFQGSLRETAWRRPLTAAETEELRAWLAAHPEAAADWEAETALSQSMLQLPQTPVPSNFTTRVLEEATRPQPASRRLAQIGRPHWLSWMPRIAVPAVALALTLAVYQQHKTARREQIARDLATLSDIAAVSDPRVMQDFEAIRRLGQTPTADEELIALLK